MANNLRAFDKDPKADRGVDASYQQKSDPLVADQPDQRSGRRRFGRQVEFTHSDLEPWRSAPTTPRSHDAHVPYPSLVTPQRRGSSPRDARVPSQAHRNVRSAS